MIYGAVALVVLSLIVCLLLYITNRQAKLVTRLNRKVEQVELSLVAKLDGIKSDVESQQASILQLPKIIERQSLQNNDIENVIKLCSNFQVELDKIQNELQLLQSQNSEDKLYVRAKKLIALGADIEEVILETGISRSEADLLMSIGST